MHICGYVCKSWIIYSYCIKIFLTYLYLHEINLEFLVKVELLHVIYIFSYCNILSVNMMFSSYIYLSITWMFFV